MNGLDADEADDSVSGYMFGFPQVSVNRSFHEPKIACGVPNLKRAKNHGEMPFFKLAEPIGLCVECPCVCTRCA